MLNNLKKLIMYKTLRTCLCQKCEHFDYFVHLHCQYCGDLVDTQFFLTEEDALMAYPDAEFKKTKATTKEAFVFAGDCTFCKPTN